MMDNRDITDSPIRSRSKAKSVGVREVLVIGALLVVGFVVKAILLPNVKGRESSAVRRALRPFLEPPGKPRHRVLVIGWDGATYNMIDPLVEAGRLPNVRRMMDNGVSMELESTIIPISSAAWTSAVTGKGPGKTGIFSFLHPLQDSYAVDLISARDRQAAPLWRILNHFGLKTHVVGVPITYPPEPVDGVMIAGMLSPLDASYAWPLGLADALRSIDFVPDLGLWRANQEFNGRILTEHHERKVRLLRVLLEESDWDMTLVVFKSLDVLKHRLYSGVPRGPVAEHYAQLDDALGQLLKSAGPDTDVLLMSDHGFGTYEQMLSIHGCLAELGLAHTIEHPERLRVSPADPLAVGRAVGHLNEIYRLDMARTLAFCPVTEGNYAALRINLRGREPRGCVSPEEREEVIGEIMDKLLSFRLKPNGQPIFTRVLRFSEMYPGPHADLMPDLLIEADRKYQCHARYFRPVVEYLTTPRPEHELMGVLIAAGPSIRQIADRGRASILDIAPTVMQLFSLPAFREMDGRVLTEILRIDARSERIDEPDLPAWVGTGAEDETGSVEEVMERLRALGYVGASDDSATDEPEPEPELEPERD